METSFRSLRFHGCCAASALCVASGCVQSNHRLTIGDEVALAAFTEREPTSAEDRGVPTLRTVTREEWSTVEFRVPSDGVGHRPNYRTHWLTDRTLARARGEHPTATTAFELGQSGSSSQIQEALIAPFNQIFDAATMPVMLLVEPQTAELRSPYRRFERSPSTSMLPSEACAVCVNACTAEACPKGEAR